MSDFLNILQEKKEEEKTEKEEKKNRDKREPGEKKSRTRHVKKIKILDYRVLADLMKTTHLNITGEKTVKHFIFKRHKPNRIDVSILTYLIALYRILKNGGYE